MVLPHSDEHEEQENGGNVSDLNLKYTPAEICQCFDIPRTTLFRWEKEGFIPRVRRDKEGNRIYSQDHFQRVGKKLCQHLEELENQIRSQIENLDEGSKATLRELIAEHTFVDYMIHRDETRFSELQLLAERQQLSDSILKRILCRASQLPIDSEEYIELITVLFVSIPSSRK